MIILDCFKMLNNAAHNENYKWYAIANFQAVFDLSVADSDFVDMLKKSRDATLNLVDSYTQPFGALSNWQNTDRKQSEIS